MASDVGANDNDRRERARQAARDALIANLVALGVQVALVLVILQKDRLRRVWLGYRWHVLREWRHADEERAIADLRRDISRMEHEGFGL